MNHPPTVTRDEWTKARLELLAAEKELTRARDEISRRRRELPRVEITKSYVFEGPEGTLTLADLFAGRSQLIIQHFMFGPGWREGCVGCSFLADHADGANQHLGHHDVSLVAVSRAPFAELEAFRHRMRWKFPWVSSFGSDFNYDFHVSFTAAEREREMAYANYRFCDPGIDEIGGHSVFYRDEAGVIFHSYSTFGRGDELLIGAYQYLDLTPLGRNETGPNHDLTDWVRHHDRYGEGGHVDETGRFHESAASACCNHSPRNPPS